MRTWLVVFKSPGRVELGVVVEARDVLEALSAGLERWPYGDLRDVIKVEHR